MNVNFSQNSVAALAFVSIFALTFTATQTEALLPSNSIDGDAVNTQSDLVQFNNPVAVYKNGELVTESTNVLMEGEEAVEYMISTSSSSDAWETIALGDGTAPADGDGSLDAEKSTNGLGPKTATVEDVGDGEWNLTATFTATGTDTVSTTAVKSTTAGTDYDYFAGTDFGRDLNVQDGDEIRVEWNFKVTG